MSGSILIIQTKYMGGIDIGIRSSKAAYQSAYWLVLKKTLSVPVALISVGTSLTGVMVMLIEIESERFPSDSTTVRLSDPL